MKDVFVQLTIAGTEVGPFTIIPLPNAALPGIVSRADLIIGQIFSVPDNTVIIRLQSNGLCTNHLDLIIGTTTTTTTTQPATTTTTTTLPGTTTSSTTTTTTTDPDATTTTTTSTSSTTTTTTTDPDATTTTTTTSSTTTTTTTVPETTYTVLMMCVDGIPSGDPYETTNIPWGANYLDQAVDGSSNYYVVIGQYGSTFGYTPVVADLVPGQTGCPTTTSTTTTSTTTEAPVTTTSTTTTTTTGLPTKLYVYVTGAGNNGTKITDVAIGSTVYIAPGAPLIADQAVGDGRYTRSTVFDIDPGDFGSKSVSMSWYANDLDYENSNNAIAFQNGPGFGGCGLYHYGSTTGSCSASTTIVAGNSVIIIANLDNS